MMLLELVKITLSSEKEGDFGNLQCRSKRSPYQVLSTYRPTVN